MPRPPAAKPPATKASAARPAAAKPPTRKPRRDQSHPDLLLEQRAGVLVCGVDEVGRGPLAGPVLAGAVILAPDLPPGLARAINDSKLLSRAAREALEPEVRAHARVALGQASVAEIDQLNILQATLLAMQRAVAALGITPDHVLVDGKIAPALGALPVTPVVNGDQRSLSIAAASIVAKVARDRLMRQLAEECPGYGWEHNAGYPTAEHRDALLRLGVTRHHRRSFAPVARCFPLKG